MKKRIAVLAAFVLVSVQPTSVFAIEPTNPVEGAVRRVYNIKAKDGSVSSHKSNFQEIARTIKTGTMTAYSTSVDTNDEFKTNSEAGGNPEFGMWTGFLKRKNTGLYTIVFNTNGGNLRPMYSLWINGHQVIDSETETTAVTIPLNAGFNEMCLIVEDAARGHITISIKKADSLKEPANIGPDDLWHEDEPDDEDDED